MSPSLDWFLPEPDRIALVCAASRRRAAKIDGDAVVEVSSDAFERRATRVLGRPWAEHAERGCWLASARARSVRAAASRASSSRRRRRPCSSSPNGSWYGEPPTLEVHRWRLLAADRRAARLGELDLFDLRAALDEAADARWWRWSLTTSEPPALATIAIESTVDDAVAFTIVASRFARLVGARVPEQPDAPSLTRGTYVMSRMGANGWRWAPSHLLDEPYDGDVAEPCSAGVTWGRRLFGAAWPTRGGSISRP